MKPNFCSFCGVQLPVEQQEAAHPHCTACGTTHWQNPRPVAVLLQPARTVTGKLGLVILRRGIMPFRGELALPSGFVEKGESIEEAASRELWEELHLTSPAEQIRLLDSIPTPHDQTLVFCTTDIILDGVDTVPFVRTAEALSRGVSPTAIDLCFPLHTAAMQEWFRGQS